MLKKYALIAKISIIIIKSKIPFSLHHISGIVQADVRS
jgi:hypothetical protein